MTHCPFHPDDQPCPRKDAHQAAELVAACRTDREAARVAIESIRVILANYSSTRPRGRNIERLAGQAAELFAMPDEP